MSKLTNLTPSIRLSIKNLDSESGSVFGRGIADLCLGVREKGSLNAAAKSIGVQQGLAHHQRNRSGPGNPAAQSRRRPRKQPYRRG